MVKSFDLIVVGSGLGLEVSSQAADSGLSVAVIESGPFGGTCLNRGCIPSKVGMPLRGATILVVKDASA